MAKKKIIKVEEEEEDKDIGDFNVESTNKIINDIKRYVISLYKKIYLSKDQTLHILKKLGKLNDISSKVDLKDLREYENDLRKKIIKSKLSFDDSDIIIRFNPLNSDVKIPVNGDCFICSFYRYNEETNHFDKIDSSSYKLKSLDTIICGLGFSVEIPKFSYISIFMKNEIVIRYGITTLGNQMFDHTYKNEVMIPVINLYGRPINLTIGNCIAKYKVMREIRCSPDIIRKINDFIDAEIDYIENIDKIEENKKIED